MTIVEGEISYALFALIKFYFCGIAVVYAYAGPFLGDEHPMVKTRFFTRMNRVSFFQELSLNMDTRYRKSKSEHPCLHTNH